MQTALELVGAIGVSLPSDVRPEHIMRRISPHKARSRRRCWCCAGELSKLQPLLRTEISIFSVVVANFRLLPAIPLTNPRAGLPLRVLPQAMSYRELFPTVEPGSLLTGDAPSDIQARILSLHVMRSSESTRGHAASSRARMAPSRIVRHRDEISPLLAVLDC